MRKNFPLAIQAVWSSGFNLVSRILPSYFAQFATASEISLIYLLYASAKFLGIPCGWLSDKIGKTKTLFLVFLLLPFLAISFTFSNSVIFFAFMFFLIGLLGNFYYPSINAVVTIFFSHKKTEYLFKLETMYQLGMVLGPIIGGVITFRYGIDKAFYTWAILAFLGLILSGFLFKKESSFNPKTKIKKINIKEFLSQLGEKKFEFIIFLIMGSFLTGLFEAVFSLALPLYATKIGFNISKVGWIMGLGSLVSIFGLLFLGKRLKGKKISLILTTFLVGLSCVFLIFINSLIGIVFLLGIFTLGRAGGLNITRSFISEILNENLRATGMSISDFAQYLGKFIGPPFAGVLIDKINIFASFASISIISILGILLLILYQGKK